MPPRKKTTDSQPAVPTRVSTRIQNKGPVPQVTPASTSTAKPKAAAKKSRAAQSDDEDAGDAPAPVTKKPKAKAASKRTRAAVSDNEDVEDAQVPAPATKKAKAKATSKRTRAAQSDDEEAPAAKKTKANDTGAAQQAQASSQAAEDKKEKMVTVVKRGAAPVDPMSGLVDTHQVYADAEGVWDAMLNQTDISGNTNSNKFYAIQLLHPIGNSGSCYLYTRWGRIGESGASQRKGPFDATTAVREFKKQFKAKTSTNWEQRHGMIARKGKYVWIERSFEDDKDEDEDETVEAQGSKTEDEPPPESQLAPELQAFCKLIFSTKLADAVLSSMNYDANKLPLGKLAKSTILNGFAALKLLAEVLEKPAGETATQHGGLYRACEELSGRYYSIIPHAFGRNRPRTINTVELLKKELDLVDALGDMEIASKLITSTILKDEQGRALNPIDSHFKSLRLSSMDPVNRKSNEFKTLEKYAHDTHGETHGHFKVDVLNVFRVERQNETEAWMNAGFDKLGDGERMLLWHGSRATNFAGILSQGLRIAPPEAPVTGYMFGKGVYFADMMSKSAGYCHTHLSDKTGVLLLCEVAAKPFFEQPNANYNADQDCKANNKLATKGIGRFQPTEWQDAGVVLGHQELEGCHMPKGPGKLVDYPGAMLQYNEYIVYDASQIRLRYLLMVKMG